ncbi:2204_t:CDS:2 [Entrophospora sp. SA101]|nr:7733_t:CDS:2 [Entrophospora sp. SA101]CAJ0834355.1 2204_t:CDS:2 [Entrophospora sp. SA101]
MSNNKILFCLVEGGSKEKAFKVIAEINDDVSDLKEKIKGRRPNTFANIDAAEIVLWKVNVPIDEDAMENITDASIHIIVNQPSAGQGNSTNVFSLIEELNNKVESGFRNVDNKVR